MKPYRHLLCPVDFSESSRQALEWSSRFSREVGARLTVLHVVDTELLLGAGGHGIAGIRWLGSNVPQDGALGFLSGDGGSLTRPQGSS
jgi:Universal stress protein family